MNVDDWELEKDNELEEKGFSVAVHGSVIEPDKAIFFISYNADGDLQSIAPYMNVDELEALATLLLYKAKLIRENDNNA